MLFKILLVFISLINLYRTYALKFGLKPVINRYKVDTKLYAKPDLFSDDLFDDDEEVPTKKDVKKEVSKQKKTYLNEDWQLSPTDQKEFKGFDKNAIDKTPLADDEKFPVFALIYKLRREYVETNIDAMIADHKGHCLNFKRLINSEVMALNDSKGVCLLFAGFTVNDKVETKAEIMSFLEEDPFIVKDFVEKWDIIDLEKKEAKELPPVAV